MLIGRCGGGRAGAGRWWLAPAIGSGGIRPPGGGEDADAFAARAHAALAPAAGLWWRALTAAGVLWLAGIVAQPFTVLAGLDASAGDVGVLLTDTRLVWLGGCTWRPLW